jgi:hypothetical protein
MDRETEDGLALVEQCAAFAERYGIDAMLDVIAGVHHAYTPGSTNEAAKLAYDLAGVSLERPTVQ